MKSNCVQEKVIELLSQFKDGLSGLTIAISVNRDYPSITDLMTHHAIIDLQLRGILDYKADTFCYCLSPLHLLAAIK